MDTLLAGGLLRRVAYLHSQLQRLEDSCCGGATMAQCTILSELRRSGPMTIGDLARALALDKGWISRSVETLTQEGLVVKTPSETDKRAVIIEMTPRGQALADEVNSALDSVSERVIRRIPAEEQETVLRALRLLEQTLEAELSSGSGSYCC